MSESMIPFASRLESRIRACGNPVCFGIDPVPSLMPIEGKTAEDKLRRWFLEILAEMVRRNVKPAAAKPNSAYFECLSVEAMGVLRELVHAYHAEGIHVVLDAKRGDIGKSSDAYARAAFDVYGADSVTVSPWMGRDSVGPFLRPERGVFVLLRTSNPGRADFQDLQLAESGAHNFEKVADTLLAWDKDRDCIGAVVGATGPGELEQLVRRFVSAGKEIPFLIPGVSIPGVPGGQGGDPLEVMRAIAAGGGKRQIHLLNSSSGLSFAWQAKGDPSRWASASVDALERLSDALR